MAVFWNYQERGDLTFAMKRGLDVAEGVYRDYGYEAEITWTTGGKHMEGSLHPSGNAVDFVLTPMFKAEIAGALRRRLGSDFDVVLESNHIHIEYDPKRG